MAGVRDKALNVLRSLPRVSLSNLKPLKPKQNQKTRRGQHGGRKRGYGDGGQGAHCTLPPLGFEFSKTPLHLAIPKEPYYYGEHLRRRYFQFSLKDLQRCIDLGRIDITQPVDLTTICNLRFFKLDPMNRDHGINLTDEGADIFAARLNIEIQWASEMTIAAIERNGGTITTRYFDPASLLAVVNPVEFFSKGIPIPRCKFPPADALEYYIDPKNRGYLADPVKVQEERLELAQKYGYTLPDIKPDDMLLMKKDPRQIFYGLEPGWFVNLKDETVLKPTDKTLNEYYKQ